jgi:beta-ribofuranosylaminobenzene 5'-phosphate synthase
MDAIEIESPARLHLGFIDPSGSGPRRFGSLGLALDGLSTRIRLSRAGSAAEAYLAASDQARPELQRAARYLETMRGAFDFADPLSLEILEAIPPHAGLGSGTQLALAIGFAMARLSGRQLTVRQIAALTERGARSGIGIGAFEQGGFVVDGGRGPDTTVPPIVARLPCPAAWRVILIFDASFVGLHGDAETAAFARLPPFPEHQADRLARLTLMQALPGLAEGDYAQFAPAISEIQTCIGDHFAPAQGGRFASPAVARWLAWFAGRGAACYGQSSWGPTGFVIVASNEEARSLVAAAKTVRAADDPVRFRSVAGRNAGAHINEFEALQRDPRTSLNS